MAMELLERDDFLRQLHNGFQKTLGGEGHSIFICGEAGIGKSSLVRRFLKEVEDQSKVFLALCDSLFIPRTLGVVYDLMLQINRMLDVKAQPTTQRTELFADVSQTIAGFKDPVVIVIEDIHWADEASLDFIKFFSRRVAHSRCLLLLTYRDNEITVQHPLRNVLGELSTGSFSRIALTPFTKETVQRLAAAKGYNGEDLYVLTGGNPFYVNEIVASYSPGIPDNIKDAVLVIFNRLNEDTKRMWELLSIMPEGLEQGWLDKIDGHWEEALETCLAVGILQIRNSKIIFKHELFRRAIESSLSPLRRLNLNRKILELFLENFEKNGAIERIVHYAKNAANNKLVAHFAPIAAKQAIAACAHTEAAKLYFAAIEHNVNNEPRHLAGLYEAYTYECYLTNQIKEAIVYQTRALEIWKEINDVEQVGNSLRFLSRLWWFNGYRKEAEKYAMQSVETFNDLPATKAKAMAFSNLSQLRMLADDVDGCLEWGKKAIAMAIQIGDEEVRCHALNNVGAVQLKVPELKKEGEKQLEESLQMALHNGFREHAARAYTNFISNNISTKDYHVADRYLQEGLEYCSQRDLYSWTWYMLLCKARMLLERGDWDAAEELTSTQLCSSAQPGIVRSGALTIRATIKIRRGEADGVTLLEEAKELAFLLNEHLRIIPVMIACLEYEWLTGSKMISNSELTTSLSLIKNVNAVYLNSEFAFWLYKTRTVEIDLPVLYEPYRYFCEGKINDAVAVWKTKDCPYETALMLFAGSEDQKREALVILQGLGADPVYQKLKSEMRSSGIRKIPRGLRSTTLSNPARLTTRELNILQLLKTGASNKEIATKLFISAKTVDHHISSILFKLDAPSRTKAVVEAEKLGILTL